MYLSRKNLVSFMQFNLVREDDSACALCIISTVACPSNGKGSGKSSSCTNSAHAHIPVAVLGLLDLPDPFPGLSPPPNFKFLARAQKGSGNETR